MITVAADIVNGTSAFTEGWASWTPWAWLTFGSIPDVPADTSSGFALGERRWSMSSWLSFRSPVFVARTAPAQ